MSRVLCSFVQTRTDLGAQPRASIQYCSILTISVIFGANSASAPQCPCVRLFANRNFGAGKSNVGNVEYPPRSDRQVVLAALSTGTLSSSLLPHSACAAFREHFVTATTQTVAVVTLNSSSKEVYWNSNNNNNNYCVLKGGTRQRSG